MATFGLAGAPSSGLIPYLGPRFAQSLKALFIASPCPSAPLILRNTSLNTPAVRPIIPSVVALPMAQSAFSTIMRSANHSLKPTVSQGATDVSSCCPEAMRGEIPSFMLPLELNRGPVLVRISAAYSSAKDLFTLSGRVSQKTCPASWVNSPTCCLNVAMRSDSQIKALRGS